MFASTSQSNCTFLNLLCQWLWCFLFHLAQKYSLSLSLIRLFDCYNLFSHDFHLYISNLIWCSMQFRFHFIFPFANTRYTCSCFRIYSTHIHVWVHEKWNSDPRAKALFLVLTFAMLRIWFWKFSYLMWRCAVCLPSLQFVLHICDGKYFVEFLHVSFRISVIFHIRSCSHTYTFCNIHFRFTGNVSKWSHHLWLQYCMFRLLFIYLYIDICAGYGLLPPGKRYIYTNVCDVFSGFVQLCIFSVLFLSLTLSFSEWCSQPFIASINK